MLSDGILSDQTLRGLVAESIDIIREAYVGARNPIMLYSIGKDSSALLALCQMAFAPGRLPFPLLHIDTTWKFRQMIEFRDNLASSADVDLIVSTNQEGLAAGYNPFDHGPAYTDVMKTQALRKALDSYRFDVVFAGARRDEEASRAKERIFSPRDPGHRWDPREQRPEFWSNYNTRVTAGHTLRVFPLSNWTELQIWRFIKLAEIPVVDLYFARPRPVVERDGHWIMVDDGRLRLRPGEQPQLRKVRFRTLGCYPLTAGFESEADTIEKIIDETATSTYSERRGRLIDRDAPASMEKKKSEGYF